MLLPFTQLFLEEFSNKPLKASEELIRRFLDTTYPSLASVPPATYKLVLEQFYHNLLFVLTQITTGPSEGKWEAARAIIGILFAVLINDCEWFGGSGGKNKDNDFELFCRLVKQHSVNSSKDKKCQLLTVDQAAKLIRFAKTGYFAHHNLLFKWQNFKKREDQQAERIFVDVPMRVYNTRATTWVDLSKREEAPQEQPPQAPQPPPS